MAQAVPLRRARFLQPAEMLPNLLRRAAVIGCALALIAAGPALPTPGFFGL